jgi:hypothetical protein
VFTSQLHRSGSSSIVTCVFVAAGMFLPSRCLAMNVCSFSTIPAFRRHVKICSPRPQSLDMSQRNLRTNICNNRVKQLSDGHSYICGPQFQFSARMPRIMVWNSAWFLSVPPGVCLDCASNRSLHVNYTLSYINHYNIPSSAIYKSTLKKKLITNDAIKPNTTI